MAILLALVGAFFFGILSALTRRALKAAPDAVTGAVVTDVVALAVSVAVVAITRSSLDGVTWHSAWPFLLAGCFVPGISQILFVKAITLSGPARTSTAVGVAPLVSAFIAIVVLDEPFRWWLVLGTVLVVAGVVSLAWDRRRPDNFRAVGLLFAAAAAILFGVRDNLVRWAEDGSTVAPLVGATLVLLTATATATTYLVVTRRAEVPALVRRSAHPFVLPGFALGFAFAGLTEAFDRAKVTIVAPLNATSSLWGVVGAVVLMRSTENVGRRLVLAALLIVAGAIVVGALR